MRARFTLSLTPCESLESRSWCAKHIGYKKGADWNEDDDGSLIFCRGSAIIHIFFYEEADVPFVNFLAPIVKLPPQNLLPFYRRLLELNFQLCGAVSLGVNEDVIFVCMQSSIEGLTEIGLAEIIETIGVQVDELDDLLHEEFNAPFFNGEE